MYTVVLSILIVFAAVVIVISMLANTSTAERKRQLEKRVREEAERKKMAKEVALLSVPGEPLICLGCQTRFKGPMPPEGCPECMMASLVVAERVYKHKHV